MGRRGSINFIPFSNIIYFLFQSLRNLAIPASVKWCLIIPSITLYGIVAMWAPAFATSFTCKGFLILAAIISVLILCLSKISLISFIKSIPLTPISSNLPTKGLT